MNVMHATAFSVAGLVFLRECRRNNLRRGHAVAVSLLSFIVFRVGSYVLFSLETGYWREAWWRYLDFDRGGMSLYGGLVLTIACVALYSRIAGIRFLALLDAMAPSIALGTSVGKIGCFLEGCCYGFELRGRWSFLSVGGMKFFPTQLLESLINVSIAAALMSMPSDGYPAGRRIGTYFFLYGSTRFLADFTRYNQVAISGLTMAQIYSIPLMLLGIAIVYSGHPELKRSFGET